jgi:hypothetical protein
LADPGASNAFEPDANIRFEKWGEYWRRLCGVRFIYDDGVDQATLTRLLLYNQLHRFPLVSRTCRSALQSSP